MFSVKILMTGLKACLFSLSFECTKQNNQNTSHLERKKALYYVDIELLRSPEAEKPSVPLAGDELDGEEEDDTLERCGGCRRGMKNGAVGTKL